MQCYKCTINLYDAASVELRSSISAFKKIEMVESILVQGKPQFIPSPEPWACGFWLHQGNHGLKSTIQWYIITALATYITMEPSLPQCITWSLSLQDLYSNLYQGFFHPEGSLVNLSPVGISGERTGWQTMRQGEMGCLMSASLTVFFPI